MQFMSVRGVALALALGLVLTSSVHAAFNQVAQFTNLPGLWLTRENGRWDGSTTHGWTVNDDQFQQTGNVNVGGSVGIRGIDYDPFSGLMIVDDYESDRILRTTASGQTIATLFVGASSKVNDVSADPRDGTFWVARFGGPGPAIRHPGERAPVV